MSLEKYKRGSRQWWDAIGDIYIRGEADTIHDLVKLSGYSKATVYKRASASKWRQKREEFEARSNLARKGAIANALELSKKTQADTRVTYAEHARKLAAQAVKLAEKLIESNRLDTQDLQRLTASLKACKDVEFSALGIAGEVLAFDDPDREGNVATWEEAMKRRREKLGLSKFTFAAHESSDDRPSS